MAKTKEERPTSIGQKVTPETWKDHVNKGHTIKYFTVVDTNTQKIMFVKPPEGSKLVPLSEYYGSHSQNWIIAVNTITGEEYFRQNLQFINLIEWDNK